jgi:protoheme IX farnesyltransferase
MFGAISIFLYTSAYTPLKDGYTIVGFCRSISQEQYHLCLGWVAATGNLVLKQEHLFLIQFFWQFPHFWAIGWFLYEDYEKAGFFMLPTGKKMINLLQHKYFIHILVINSFTFAMFRLYRSVAYIKLLRQFLYFCLGIWMLIYAFKLYQQKRKSSKNSNVVSVSYITLLQIIYIVDKFLR